MQKLRLSASITLPNHDTEKSLQTVGIVWIYPYMMARRNGCRDLSLHMALNQIELVTIASYVGIYPYNHVGINPYNPYPL